MSTSLQLSASAAAPSIRSGRLDPTALYSELAKRFEQCKFYGIFEGAGATPPPLLAPPAAPKGALAGIPFVVGPDFDVAACPTHAGVGALRVAVAASDAPTVAAFKARGAHLLGQVTGTEFSLAVAGGVAKNPFTTFGLSGGSAAAAVGARVATLGLAIDTTGAARASAALCGVAAFRPTHGRYTRGGTLSLSPTLGTVAVIARTVRDLQLADAVLCSSSGSVAAASASAATTAAAAALVVAAPSEAEGAAAGEAAPATIAEDKSEAAMKMQSVVRGFVARRRVAAARSGSSKLQGGGGAGAMPFGLLSTPSKGDALRTARLLSHGARGAERLGALEAGEGEAPPAAAHSDGGPPGSPSSPHPLLPRGLFAAELDGVRIGVPRSSPMFTSLTPAAAAVVEAALSRLVKAGAVLVDVELEGEGGEDIGSVAAGCAATLLGYDAPRELAAYALTRTVPQPKPLRAPPAEGEEEAAEEEEEAAAASAPAPLVPLDSLVGASSVLRGYKGPAQVSSLLSAQLSHTTAATASQYRSALVYTRPAIKRAFTTMFKRNRLAALVYPATLLPPALLKGVEGTSVELNGAQVVRVRCVCVCVLLCPLSHHPAPALFTFTTVRPCRTPPLPTLQTLWLPQWRACLALWCPAASQSRAPLRSPARPTRSDSPWRSNLRARRTRTKSCSPLRPRFSASRRCLQTRL